MIKQLSKRQKVRTLSLENKIEWINFLDLVQKIKKEEGKRIAYFNADLVKFERAHSSE
jgi:hypothetical protein